MTSASLMVAKVRAAACDRILAPLAGFLARERTKLRHTWTRARGWVRRSLFLPCRRLFELALFEIMQRLRGLYLPWRTPRHPFVVWRLHPVTGTESPDENKHRLHLWNDEFRLVPDRLALYDLGFGLMFLAVSWGILGAWVWGVISLFFLWLALPTVLQVAVIRPTVFAGLDASVSPALRRWFEGLPSHTVTFDNARPGARTSFWTATSTGGLLLLHMLRKRVSPRDLLRISRTDPVYTQASSSPQGAFLALALASHFAPDESDGDALSRGFRRFFLTYCSPLWTAYLWLLLTALIFGNEAPALTAMAFGWAAIALWFLLSAVIRYGEWLDVISSPLTALKTLPYAPIWRALPWPPPDLHVVRDRWVRLATAAITATGLAIMLAAFQVLPPTGALPWLKSLF